MAELADALDLGSSGNTRAGSSPVIRTYNSRSSKGVIFIVRYAVLYRRDQILKGLR